MRFGARDGALVAGRTVPGRGVYTCRNRACFERAAASRNFQRVLRRPVHIGPDLAGLYTEGAHGQ